MASFTTDSIIIIHTKARNYKHSRYSYKTTNAKKVELEHLADLRLCARCSIFKLHFPTSWIDVLGARSVGTECTGGTSPPPFFKGPKVPFFVMKSNLFVQANVALNTKLTSKVPFLFGFFDVFKENLVKTCNFGMVWRENFSVPFSIS
jgi:hypothetical protein